MSKLAELQVADQHIITITYELRHNNHQGKLLERMNANYPFIFLFGSGKLLPAFEANLAGLTSSDGFDFTLSAADAYGPRYLENVVEVPKRAFEQQGMIPDNVLVIGNYVALTDDQGDTHNGKILSWNEATVKVDFNHAMAGMDLHFKGAILNIRPATVDELVRQHYIPD